jgi:formate dehydrogenase major subunit
LRSKWAAGPAAAHARQDKESSHKAASTHTPAYKETSVRIVVLDEVGESPLPKVNSRFGHPTPQQGVEVERKWKRIDYEMPKGEPVPDGQPVHAAPKELRVNGD